jgi:hypothetical protein
VWQKNILSIVCKFIISDFGDVNLVPVFGQRGHMKVGFVTDISEEPVASIFRVKMTGVRTVTAYRQSDGTMITHNHGRGLGDCDISANNTCKKPLPHIVIIQKQDQHHH